MGAVLDCVGEQRRQMFADCAAWLAERSERRVGARRQGYIVKPNQRDIAANF